MSSGPDDAGIVSVVDGRRAIGEANQASERRGPAERAVFSVLAVVLAVVSLANGGSSFTPDTRMDLYLAPWRLFRSCLSAWLPNPELGSANFNTGYLPVAAVVGSMEKLGLTPTATMRLLHFGLLLVAGWGAVRVYRRLADPSGGSAPGRVAVAVAYVGNPYVVVAGSALPILLPYALLPWALLALLRATEEPQSWRWPATFALAFLAMGGLNAGVVPLMQLLVVPVVLGYLGLQRRIRWRFLVRVTAKASVLCLLVSAYWLVPSLLSLSTGTSVVAGTESATAIAATSSFGEVVRGLGFWPLYGADSNGPWLPNFSSYLTDPAVLVLSYGLVVFAVAGVLRSRARARLLAVGMLVVAAVVMVGLHPPSDPSPFGRLLRWAFDTVPGMGAFRTTNKVGSILALAVALLVGLAATEEARRKGRRPFIAAAVVSAIVAGGTYPAWAGHLYPVQLDIPSYWHQAASDLNAAPSTTRVLIEPGDVLAAYRWGHQTPDDLSNSLLSRPSVLRTVQPITNPEAANFLAALDVTLNTGAMPAGGLSTMARYLGAGDVLIRNDTVWENSRGASPAVFQAQVNADQGLQPLRNYGAPGEWTRSPKSPPGPDIAAILSPLQRYQVTGAAPIIRAEGATSAVTVDGDNFAVPAMVQAGLMRGQPAYRLAGDLNAAEFRDMLGQGRRVVLTDTNRRVTWYDHVLSGATTALLPATAPVDATRALFGAAQQTVATYDGVAGVTASTPSLIFGSLAYAGPDKAVDGDPRTAWLFGNFRTAVGRSLTIRLQRPRDVFDVHIRLSPAGPVQIASLRVTVGSASRVITTHPGRLDLTAQFPGSRSDRITVTVTGQRGDGYNPVGIAEVGIAGVRATEVARLPLQVARLAAALDPQGRHLLAQTPLDVLLTRVSGTASPQDDEETALNRDFTLPDTRSFVITGHVRTARRLPEAFYDRLEGASGGTKATSSSHAFDWPPVRAASVADGNPLTAWVPAEPAVGQWVQVRSRPHLVDHITVRQPVRRTDPGADWATLVRISMNGRRSLVARLHPGTTSIRIPATRLSSVRVTILRRHAHGVIRFGEVDFGAPRIRFGTHPGQCVAVATVDGQPLRVQLVGRAEDVASSRPVALLGCGSPLTLAAGPHRLRSVRGWTLDDLALRDRQGLSPTPVAAGPAVTVTQRSSTHLRLRTGNTSSPFFLVTGQMYDSRWHAAVDGRSLGPPEVLDGYAVGWRISDGRPHVITVDYGPQKPTIMALAVSAAGLLLCFALAIRPRRRRRVPEAVALAPDQRPARHYTALSTVLAWVVVISLAYVLGGSWAGIVAALVAGAHAAHPPSPRALLTASAVALAAVPVVWIAGNLSRFGTVSFNLVGANPWPHRVAVTGLLLLAVGAVRSAREVDSGQPPEAIQPSGSSP